MSLPPPILRPGLAAWLFSRGLVDRHAADALGVSRETVRRYCLPFDDPARHTPRPEIMEKIVLWTRGEITPADFYPPAPVAFAAADEAAA